MYWLREFKSFNINPNLLKIFRSSMICGGGGGGGGGEEGRGRESNIQKQDRRKNSKKSKGIVSKKTERPRHIVPTMCDKQNVRNHKDPTHPLHKEKNCRQIERSGRYSPNQLNCPIIYIKVEDGTRRMEMLY